jgi:1-deoxy-D-xylulose-5-phosphate reductoisomerase
MKKCISILGSTGSIGVQALDVVRNLNMISNPDIRVLGLTADKNIDLLEKQAREFKPEAISITEPQLAKELASRLDGQNIRVFSGNEGLNRIATLKDIDMVLNSIVGVAGLIPTFEAIKHKKNIALANKETLVAAGRLIMEEIKKNNVKIIPVDSEHSAIFQCIMGNNEKNISKLILTASGGPFRGLRYEDLTYITPEEALKHPNWKMGNKITIDSATLMNKGLEVIEAKWLFDINEENIEVLIHPQSIIHSMVEYIDGSVIAQLGSPDMRIPIQFALTYPERSCNSFSRLDLIKKSPLTFEEPDWNTFPCLKLAYQALEESGTMPAVMNRANEIAVDLFLNRKIGFNQIPEIIEKVMKNHIVNKNPTINDIIEVDKWAIEEAGILWENLN